MDKSYRQYIQGTEAILPYGILRIDSRAFEGCKGLTSIKIHIEQPSEAEKVFMDMNPEYFGEIALYTGTPATNETPASEDYMQLCTANFILLVERAALDKDTLSSESEVRQLVNIVDRSAPKHTDDKVK